MGKSEVPTTFNFKGVVSIDGVQTILNKVNPKKAIGYDQIPPRCLRDALNT